MIFLYMKKALFQRIFFSISFLFLTAIVWNMGPDIYKAYQADQYIETSCTIHKNEWIQKGDGYSLALEYSYQHDQQSFTGTRYMWGLKFFENQNRQGAKDFVKKVAVGSQHSCFIDPKNPSDSVIYKGLAYEKYEIWVVIIFFLLFGWGFFVSWFYPKEAEEIFIPSDPS
jgi:hypothetical protein